MTTIIKAASAADFLALVPHLAGYTPSNSLAMVPFHRGRTLGVLRFDLPRGDAAEVDRIASTVIGMVCKLPEADGVAPVVFTDDPFRHGDEIAHADLVGAVIRRADDCGLKVPRALCLAADGWGSYLDPDCPPGGRPRTDLAVDPPVPDGRDVSQDQHAGLELPPADLAAKERLARALRGVEDAARVLCGAGAEADGAAPGIADLDPMALAAVCALDDVPTLFEDALRWDAAALRPFDAAALLWCLARPALRDVALSQWSADRDAGDAALDFQLRWLEGDECSADVAVHLFGEGPRPDRDRVTAALELTRHVAAAAPRAMRVAPLAAAAWLAWALGHSTAADWHARQALEVEPDHGLAGIVASFVAAGHVPEWAFERPAA